MRRCYLWLISLGVLCVFVSGCEAMLDAAWEHLREAPERRRRESLNAKVQWQQELLRQAEIDPSRSAEIKRKVHLVEFDYIRCKHTYPKVCYNLMNVPQKINLQGIVSKLENEKKFLYNYVFLVKLLSFSDNIDENEAAALGMRPLPSAGSEGQLAEARKYSFKRAVRAALLRRALKKYSFEPKRVVGPMAGVDPRHKDMAERMLELDMAEAKEPAVGGKNADELYLGMDNELGAYLSSESEFRIFADRAMNHYVNVMQTKVSRFGGELEWWRSVTALLHYDRLAVNEAQRLKAVRLFIKNVPNISINCGNYQYDDPYLQRLAMLARLGGFTEIMQPCLWDYLLIEWRADWGKQLDELLQANGKSREISALLSRAYTDNRDIVR